MSTSKRFTNEAGAPVADNTSIMTAGPRGPALLQDIWLMMLQARLFSYNDALRYRLGVNFDQIPVNAPKCPFHSYHRDGAMRVDGNLGRTISFNPNGDGLWDKQPDFAEPPLPLEDEAAHWDHRVDDDHWEQPGNLFRKMTPAQQQLLFENTARAMGDAKLHIKERHVANCAKADPAYGKGVADALAKCADGEL